MSRQDNRAPRAGREGASMLSPARQLSKAAERVQTALLGALNTAELDSLAVSFTLLEPRIDDVPFCTALAATTFLFHMQMDRVGEAEVQPYVVLISRVLGLLPHGSLRSHPFVTDVIRRDLLGIDSRLGAHHLVLLPPAQYEAFSAVVLGLHENGALPVELMAEWRRSLEEYTQQRSPLVSLRAQILLVKTAPRTSQDIEIDCAELQRVIASRPTRINMELLLLCYARLRRVIPHPEAGDVHAEALSILSSELFLKFRSPIRREYIERYLYPALAGASPQTQAILDNDATRRHILTGLLRQCTAGMPPTTKNGPYMCLCALLQQSLSEEYAGAEELVALMECLMPHAAWFISALAVDTRMRMDTFDKIVMLLVRGAAHVMFERDPQANGIASIIDQRAGMVYNILYALRDIVRQCGATNSRRAEDLLRALRAAVSADTVRVLGGIAARAFEGRCDITIEPQLLCAELAMMLHGKGVSEAVDACLAYLDNANARCQFCDSARGSSLLCPVNGSMHLNNIAALTRVLSTVSDCCNNPAVVQKLINLLRHPDTQLSPTVHALMIFLLRHAGQHRAELLQSLDPYLRALLVAVHDGDGVGRLSSEIKASVLFLHVRLVPLMPQDALQLQATIKVIGSLRINNNHDALTLWCVCHRLLRSGKSHVELLALDPVENNYGQGNAQLAPCSFAAADNAQLLLQILSRVHAYSDVTRKLTGPSVCRLIQDFNLQATNIVTALLTPVGLVRVAPETASKYAMPVSPQSFFWSFFLRQIRGSAPARTSLIVAAARALTLRFQGSEPASAVSVRADETSHLFAGAFLQVLCQDSALARIVSNLTTKWIRLPNHPHGKFTLLTYFLTQMLYAVSQAKRETYNRLQQRGSDTMKAREKRSLTIFSEASADITSTLKDYAIPKIVQLLPLVRANPSFYVLAASIGKSAKLATKECGGGPGTSSKSGGQAADEDDAIFDVPVEIAAAAHQGMMNSPIRAGAHVAEAAPEYQIIEDYPQVAVDDNECFLTGYQDLPDSWGDGDHPDQDDDVGCTDEPQIAPIRRPDASQTAPIAEYQNVTGRRTMPPLADQADEELLEASVLRRTAPPDAEKDYLSSAVSVRDGTSQTSPHEHPARDNTTTSRFVQAAVEDAASDVVLDYLYATQSRATWHMEKGLHAGASDGGVAGAESAAVVDTRDGVSLALSQVQGVRRESPSHYQGEFMSNQYHNPHTNYVEYGVLTANVPSRPNDYNQPHREQHASEFTTVTIMTRCESTPMVSGGKRPRPDEKRAEPAETPRTRSLSRPQQPRMTGADAALQALQQCDSALAEIRQMRSVRSDPMGAYKGQPVPQALVDQGSSAALLETREALGRANPNTVYARNGQPLKKTISGNQFYRVEGNENAVSTRSEEYALLIK